LQSSRFPKKVLVDIKGVPMVIATAKRVENIDEVAIATDAPEVMEVAKKYGFKAIMTAQTHQSGTDRINEAANKLGICDYEIVVNVQADEPFIESEVVEKLYSRMKEDRDIFMASCHKVISKDSVDDPNMVKVVLDNFNNAIYFSRSKIPYDRENCDEYFGHLGLYAFRKRTLNEFCNLGKSPLEDIEKLEQLRALYYGKNISMVQVESDSFGIDTEADLQKALNKV
jgi:3-deoxy-manno-octulosonate cytidylyltransferase (CMP-KDO synthetase)